MAFSQDNNIILISVEGIGGPTVYAPLASTSVKGIASFSALDFILSGGHVILAEPRITTIVNKSIVQTEGDQPLKIMSQQAVTNSLNGVRSEYRPVFFNPVDNNDANKVGTPRLEVVNFGTPGARFKISYIKGEPGKDLTNELAAETDARQAADDALRADINAETSTRINDVYGLQSSINIESSRRTDGDMLLQSDINVIDSKIPTQATASNQLADKDFVNSSVQNMAAKYVVPTPAGDTQWQSLESLRAGPWYYRGATYAPTEHDYAVFIETDDTVWRAAFDGGNWSVQYKVNDTPFTAAQLAALGSGITAELLEQFRTHVDSRDNPHSITAAQIGAATVKHNALDTKYGGGDSSHYGHVRLYGGGSSTNPSSTGAYADGVYKWHVAASNTVNADTYYGAGRILLHPPDSTGSAEYTKYVNFPADFPPANCIQFDNFLHTHGVGRRQEVKCNGSPYVWARTRYSASGAWSEWTKIGAGGGAQITTNGEPVETWETSTKADIQYHLVYDPNGQIKIGDKLSKMYMNPNCVGLQLPIGDGNAIWSVLGTDDYRVWLDIYEGLIILSDGKGVLAKYDTTTNIITEVLVDWFTIIQDDEGGVPSVPTITYIAPETASIIDKILSVTGIPAPAPYVMSSRTINGIPLTKDLTLADLKISPRQHHSYIQNEFGSSSVNLYSHRRLEGGTKTLSVDSDYVGASAAGAYREMVSYSTSLYLRHYYGVGKITVMSSTTQPFVNIIDAPADMPPTNALFIENLQGYSTNYRIQQLSVPTSPHIWRRTLNGAAPITWIASDWVCITKGTGGGIAPTVGWKVIKNIDVPSTQDILSSYIFFPLVSLTDLSSATTVKSLEQFKIQIGWDYAGSFVPCFTRNVNFITSSHYIDSQTGGLIFSTSFSYQPTSIYDYSKGTGKTVFALNASPVFLPNACSELDLTICNQNGISYKLKGLNSYTGSGYCPSEVTVNSAPFMELTTLNDFGFMIANFTDNIKITVYKKTLL